MDAGELALVSPTVALEAAFWPMIAEFDAAGERYWSLEHRALAERDFGAYLALLDANARGRQLPNGYVAANTYWLVRGGTEIVGRSTLRHTLSPVLAGGVGHIGYAIRPSARRRGYGTRMLGLTLEYARARGMERVLLICDTANVGSARVIEKNGGVLANRGVSPPSGVHVSRYWIALQGR
jgi:predicted acetyltransferase